MSNGGIGSLSGAQLKQINKLASGKNAENNILIAKFKGKDVKFSAVKKPRVSSKNKQKKPAKGADIAVKTLGLRDRTISPSMAKKLIDAWQAAQGNHAKRSDIELLKEHLDSNGGPLTSCLSTSSNSLDSALGSSISGSTQSLDALDSEGQPIFGTFQPKKYSSSGSSTSGSTQSLDALDSEGQPIFGTFQPKKYSGSGSSLTSSTSSLNTLHSDLGSSSTSLDADIFSGLKMNTGKPEITFTPASDFDLPPDYPAPPPPPLPPKGNAGKKPQVPPRPPKNSPASQLTPLAELKRIHKTYGVNIRTIKINGSPVGYILSNQRNKGEQRPTTLLIETHGRGYYAGGKKIPPFTTPANTRFLMAARRNQTFEVAPWVQADAISRGQIDFSNDDQIYGSPDHGSGIRMTNYHLAPITREQGESYDLSLEKAAHLLSYFKKSAKSDGRINSFNMFMLDPNMKGHISTEDLVTAFEQQGVEYKNIIMNVCRPQQQGKVSMTKAIDNIQRAKQNRLSQIGRHGR